jgi:hypothetical protein
MSFCAQQSKLWWTATTATTTLVDVFADVFPQYKYFCKYTSLDGSTLSYLRLYLRIANTSANTEVWSGQYLWSCKYWGLVSKYKCVNLRK